MHILHDMANLMTVRLQRGDGQAWGFRLQGGKDFSAPLVLQRRGTLRWDRSNAWYRSRAPFSSRTSRGTILSSVDLFNA
uniref:PDZ domain-containing protein n=1 Tax=Anopheles epiroticus TaxID=199890 RepID=A0A182PIM4_9DIPT